MTTPRVAFLINSLGTGGAERAVLAIASELMSRGSDLRLLCLESSPANAAAPIPVRQLSNAPSGAHGIAKLVALPRLGLRLSSYVSRERVDVVVSHLFRANFVNVLSRILGGARHRAIVVNHTRLSRVRSEGTQGRVNGLLCRWLYPKADVVANVSIGATRETAEMLGLSSGRCTTLSDPIDTTAAARAAAHAPPCEAIVAVGRLVELKRFNDLLLAFSRVAPDYPQLGLRLVGDGPLRPALEQQAAESGFAERITFFGALADPFPVVAGCRAFVSTSGTEGFGMAIAEALALGVPVIAADCAYGPREILFPSSDPTQLLGPEDDLARAPFGILYPVGSTRKLEEALRLLLADGDLRGDLSRGGPARAAEFSLERSAAAYADLLSV